MTEIETLREAEAAIAADEIDVSTRLFVGGIPFDAVEDDVRRMFSEARLGVRDITMPRDSGGSNRGYAFAEMVDGRAAMAALDMAGSLMMSGRLLRIAEAYGEAPTGRRQGVGKLSERLFIARLSLGMDETGVRQVFRALDLEPVDIVIVRDKKSGQSRGFSFVTMASPSLPI